MLMKQQFEKLNRVLGKPEYRDQNARIKLPKPMYKCSFILLKINWNMKNVSLHIYKNITLLDKLISVDFF